MNNDEDTLVDFDGPSPTVAEDVPEVGQSSDIGRRVGPYRLERLIARGGMGAVYLARRQTDFEQRVALKLIHPRRRSVELVQRFAAERRILARLEHPHIARILDGGTTDDAMPYFVMEYVEGQAVDRYCAGRHLDLGQRLELFRQICAAVHFAHQNLVVHQDLKPENILITDDGTPKLLDFGIARLLSPEKDVALPVGRAMTPAYASPEQVAGLAITTASDVYSLGILLHGLLTDRLPERSSHRVKPSETLARIDPQRAQPLKGDLDAIVLKALRENPAERYGSALQLADDLARYRDELPVTAHPGNWLYHLRKAARRNKVGLAVAVLVISFAITSAVLWREAVEERQRAETAQGRAERVAIFLEDLFKAANPDANLGARLTLLEALDAGREKLTVELQDTPEIRAELLTTLGTVYNNLGLLSKARELKEEALRTRREADPSDRYDLASDLNNLGRVHYDLGEYDEAQKAFTEALEMWRRLENDAEIARTSRNLAGTLTQRGEDAQALELHREILALERRLSGPRSKQTADSLYGVGALYRKRGEPEEAESFLRRALEISVEHFGQEHTRVASVESSLGRVLHALGRFDDAEELLRRALERRRRLLGDEHRQVAGSERNLAALLIDRGDLQAAEQLLRSARLTLEQAQPPDLRALAEFRSVRGSYLAAVGRLEDAEPELLAGFLELSGLRGEGHANTCDAWHRLDSYLKASGRSPMILNDQTAASFDTAAKVCQR